MASVKRLVESSTRLFAPRLEKTAQAWQAAADQERNAKPISLLVAGAEKIEEHQKLVTVPREKIPSALGLKAWAARAALRFLGTWWLMLLLYLLLLYLLWRFWRRMTRRNDEEVTLDADEEREE